eukprot:6249692-Prymnesium_polylepis.1
MARRQRAHAAAVGARRRLQRSALRANAILEHAAARADAARADAARRERCHGLAARRRVDQRRAHLGVARALGVLALPAHQRRPAAAARRKRRRRPHVRCAA